MRRVLVVARDEAFRRKVVLALRGKPVDGRAPWEALALDGVPAVARALASAREAGAGADAAVLALIVVLGDEPIEQLLAASGGTPLVALVAADDGEATRAAGLAALGAGVADFVAAGDGEALVLALRKIEARGTARRWRRRPARGWRWRWGRRRRRRRPAAAGGVGGEDGSGDGDRAQSGRGAGHRAGVGRVGHRQGTGRARPCTTFRPGRRARSWL
jgi:hypothetical protein